MKEIIQIRTDLFRGNYSNSLSLIFLAEGYRASDEVQFYQDVYTILNRLENTFPFSALRENPTMFSVFTAFTPSIEFSYANSPQQATGRTVFESYFENGQLYANYNKINEYIDELVYTDVNNPDFQSIKIAIPKGLNEKIPGIPTYDSNKLVFTLLPTANRTDIELEVNDLNTYYAIFTSVDKHVEQVVQKMIGRLLGLGDEYDLAGSEYLKPVDVQGDYMALMFPNLYHNPDLSIGNNPSTDDEFLWRWIFDNNYNNSIPIHKNMTPNIVNRTLPAKGYTYNNVELWEGGGGFRTEVYRSAEDCVMRRKIGDILLPLKEKRVAFCPVCSELLSNLLILK